MAPASSGPAADASVLAVKFSVLAEATSDAGSTRGTTAPRVDEATANAPDWTATSTSSSARLRSPASACRSSAERAAPQHERRPDEQHPAVGGVRDRPAPQPEHDERQEAHRAQQPDPERGARDVVDLHRDGDGGDGEADERDRVPGPEPAEVGVAQRGQVDDGAAGETAGAGTAGRDPVGDVEAGCGWTLRRGLGGLGGLGGCGAVGSGHALHCLPAGTASEGVGSRTRRCRSSPRSTACNAQVNA